MKCEKIRALMMDYIYDELQEKDGAAFEEHLKKCSECREEVESLNVTSDILQQWEEPEHDVRMIVVRDKVSLFDKLKELLNGGFFKPNKIAFGFTCAFLFLFLLLAAGNTEISVKNGDFSIHMALFDHAEQPVDDDPKSDRLVEELVKQNFQLVNTLIEQSEERQNEKLAFILTSFKKELEQQRYKDLKAIQYGIKDMQKNTYQQIQEIDTVLNELVRPVDLRY